MKKLMTIAALLALVGMVATGCSKGSQSSSSAGGAAASPAAEASAVAAASPAEAEASPAEAAASPAEVAAAGGANVANGKSVFAANCAACHGADGTGGVGPNLHGTLKNPAMPRTQSAVVGWIENPKPPMPKLYPSPLSEKDVKDVAAFVLATFK